MDTLFDTAARDRILVRIESLRADAPRGWGKMDAAQNAERVEAPAVR